MKMDVTITACRRPDILMKTLHSFRHGLFRNVDCRCIINVDPVGWDCSPNVVIDVCRDYFPEVVSRTPSTPHFPAAFKWCWEQVEDAEFVFHLEDDWLLLRDIELSDMIDILRKQEDLACLRLPKFKTDIGNNRMKNWNKFFPWNGEYYECPMDLRQSVGFCGHPSLIRGDFVRTTAPLLSLNWNPEKQFHALNEPLVEEVWRWRWGVYSQPGWDAVIQDIGKGWGEQHGWAKEGSKAWFTKWEQTKEASK